jgi:phasin family protein
MAKKTTAKKPSAPKFTPKAAPSVEALFKPFQQQKLDVSNLFKGSEDWAQAGKDNVEALVKSSQLLAKSAEQITKAVTDFAQSSMEMTTKAGQTLMSVKSLQDLAEIQSELAKSSMEHFIAGASKLSDMTMKSANEALEPISARINATVEKISKAA